MRIAAAIEYDGQAYCGWQRQLNAPSVQAEVERAFSKVANHPVTTICSGRTDTGVHGIGQVIHFDTDAIREEHSWLMGANTQLPENIRVVWVKPVADEFHARFSALSRHYRYVILNRKIKSAILHGKVSWEYRPLEIARMQQAAQALIGEHDFSSYRAVACQAHSPVRHLYRLDITQQGPYIWLDLEANGFLHHMVRNIAGVLMAIGAGEQEVAWAAEVLEHRDRTLGGITAPPDGLYFVQVKYDDKFDLPAIDTSVLPWANE